jgi:hypothetical protein
MHQTPHRLFLVKPTKLTARLLRCALVATALGMTSLVLTAHAAAGDVDDTVFLKNGGRARGTVVEEDPTAGVSVRLPNGTFRSFKPQEVARVEYGNQPATLASTPPTAAPTRVDSDRESAKAAGIGSPLDAIQGSLHIESTEPGVVTIDGAEYGTLPQVIHNLSAGPHRVMVHFLAGDSVARSVGVRAGAESLVNFEATPSLEAFKLHQGPHFGLGIEPAVAYLLGEDQIGATFRAIGRISYALTRVVELRSDLVVGSFFGNGAYNGYYRETMLAFGVLLRVDLQVNWGSIYTLSIGLDVGAANADEPLIAGLHGSLLSFRFGAKREFLLNFQDGLLVINSAVVFEQTLGLSYLFL